MNKKLKLLIVSLLITALCIAPISALAAHYKYTATTKSIKLSWNKVSGAKSYNLYWDMGANPTLIKKKITSRSHTIKGLAPGTSYWFMYEGNKKKGVTKGYFTDAVYTLCAAPKNLRASSGGKGTIEVYWNYPNGAQKYAVYMATSSKGSYKKLGVVTDGAKVWGLKTGKTYYFKVAAYNKAGKLGSKSKAVKFKAK